MEAAAPASEYLSAFPSEDGVIRVLFETTYEQVPRDVGESSRSKHTLEVGGDPRPIAPKRPKLLEPFETPKGIGIVAASDSSTPLSLASPSFEFGSLLQSPGVLFIDKSRFIAAFDRILTRHFKCIVTSPPGTNKTFIMTMLAAWYNQQITTEMHNKLFMPLEVGAQLGLAQSKGQTIFSARTHLCLSFDFDDVDVENMNGKKIGRAIGEYCCGVIRQFVETHHAELGFREFDEFDDISVDNMLRKIIAALYWRTRTYVGAVWYIVPRFAKPSPPYSTQYGQRRKCFALLADVIAERLSRKHHRDLYQMGEEALQGLFDEHMDDFRKHYFRQLGLLTNSKKDKEVRSDEGRIRDKPGEGRFGYADFFLCALSWLRRNRVVVGELKYMSLYGFLRAEYPDAKTFVAAMFEDPKTSFMDHCKKKGKHLRRLPLAELRKQNYYCFRTLPNGERVGTKMATSTFLDEAEKQTQFYVDTVACGIAGRFEGVTQAEINTRLEVTAGSDEVLGVVFCGVGPRMVTTMLKTRFHYAGRSDWRSLYDE
ncbi:hypothetical protein C8R47DRAFT_715012 [Mycena vitilis]|nr:hypothetical protein C8R47DRAFT_715012 [Mycena vitilis]